MRIRGDGCILNGGRRDKVDRGLGFEDKIGLYRYASLATFGVLGKLPPLVKMGSTTTCYLLLSKILSIQPSVNPTTSEK